MYSYTQKEKNIVRHLALTKAVNLLTIDRSQSCCVPRTYVRRVIDYFLQQDSSERAYREAQAIDLPYVIRWEDLHDSIIGNRRPADLSVCYLAGPQPQNDFQKLISLGILPQNIWAFESDQSTYKQAVSQYDETKFPQPKIVKMPIEQFFRYTPKKFDIVYLDACGSIFSDQHALRCVSSLFYYQRLQPLGVLITNFARPDISKPEELRKYSGVIALYYFFKRFPKVKLSNINNVLEIEEFKKIYQDVTSKFNKYYGDFITSILSDLPSIIIPLKRFGELGQYSNLFSNKEVHRCKSHVDIDMINSFQYDSTCRFVLTLKWMASHRDQVEKCFWGASSFLRELAGIDSNEDMLINGILLYSRLKNAPLEEHSEIKMICSYFQDRNMMYQFLDCVTPSLFFDIVINQLAYPMHSNTSRSNSYLYCAKSTDMYTDVLVFDECRYIYEWPPAIHQIKNMISNKSWQYTFRFALDALVKQRMNYSNEFFFQGSVVSKNEKDFSAKVRADRCIVEE
ncbi:hypothetical protein [Fournierella massiliensis]|uniref:hypothetical protein n=1 Tax=Allofournierella massiliensis TaxID=1650663 RepID=UPI003520067D